MRAIQYGFVAISALSISACVTRERTIVRDTPVVRERTVVQQAPAGVVREREVVVTNDVHHTWWNSHHPGEPYDGARAIAAHRLFCMDHPVDSTCAGWDWQ